MSAHWFHKSVLCLLLVGFCFAHAGVASADVRTVGNLGIVDAKDAGEIATDTDGFSATLSFAQPGPQEATIRYPLTFVPVPDVPLGTNETTKWELTVRYQDGDTPTSQTQRLLVHLKQLNLTTHPLHAGELTTVATFDSNVIDTTDDASDWQVKTVSGCLQFNPESAYFLEATFTSDATPLAPLVRLGGMVVAHAVTPVADGGECE